MNTISNAVIASCLSIISCNSTHVDTFAKTPLDDHNINMITDTDAAVSIDSSRTTSEKIHNTNLKLQTIIKKDSIGNFKDFLKKLAFRESSGNWKVINRFGYAGKYQMGKAALHELHFTLNVDSFRVNPDIFPEYLQDSLVIELVKLNRKRINHYIKEYVGSTVNGIDVTESGILAASHLVGGGNVKKWLKSNGKCCPTDGNGVSIEEYIVLFSNYKLNLHT